MELAPRYCRTCGSRILVKNVCHNCNNDPLKGENYCYDCGSLTPNSDYCTHCGAKYKTTFPLKTMAAIAVVFILILALAIYFLSGNFNSAKSSNDSQTAQEQKPSGSQESAVHDTIKNNPDTSASNSQIVVTPPVAEKDTLTRNADSARSFDITMFNSDEMKSYGARCSYFLKGQRSAVLFLVSGSTGYIKTTEKTSALKRIRKGTDVAVFANEEYEAILRIDGLGGSEKEWLASCTLTVKDVRNSTSARHKVYSTCIEL